MTYFNVVAETNQNTVVTSYEPLKTRSEAYQSEAALEAEFIRMLTEQGYTRLHIHSESELISNLRTQLEKLNDYTFTDAAVYHQSRGFGWWWCRWSRPIRRGMQRYRLNAR